MTTRIATIAATLLLCGGLPLPAQERSAPPSPPPIERLEKLRFERLHETLGLSEEQTATLHQQMERSHEEMRRSFQRHKEAVEALERSLAVEPADQQALRRSLAEVQAAREQMESQRERHMAELERTLTLEQRAKFLLFNRRFDSRLRELVDKHRGPRGAEAPPGPPGPRGIAGPAGSAATREERIDLLERRIAEMERELEELRADD